MIEKLQELLKEHCPGWSPKLIAEIGANNGEQTVEFANAFPEATILALEPFSLVWPQCLERVSKYKNVIMLPLAVSPVDGVIKFFKPLTANTGYGSIYKPTGKYPQEPTPSEEIAVPSIRLDTLLRGLKLPSIDMFWLDAQAGELAILISLGDRIKDTKVVYTEYILGPIYEGQPSAQQLAQFLVTNGLEPVWNRLELADWWGDACFIRP
jgi:FkbM family methyltransferase